MFRGGRPRAVRFADLPPEGGLAASVPTPCLLEFSGLLRPLSRCRSFTAKAACSGGHIHGHRNRYADRPTSHNGPIMRPRCTLVFASARSFNRINSVRRASPSLRSQAQPFAGSRTPTAPGLEGRFLPVTNRAHSLRGKAPSCQSREKLEPPG
jgi:hypothetical protein